MVKRIIVTEISPQLQRWLGESWPKVLATGIGLVLAGIFVLALPRLVAAILAIAIFIAAALVLVTAYNLWQLHTSDQANRIEVD